ncbi:hypothetical protein FACS1894217_04650 [Clostridia bacterium]|nr:hypothetical protein FACS1894217_04650 [Clostridia bacterium]
MPNKNPKPPIPQNFKYCAACRDFSNPTTCNRPIRKGQPTTADSRCKYWRFNKQLSEMVKAYNPTV